MFDAKDFDGAQLNSEFDAIKIGLALAGKDPQLVLRRRLEAGTIN